MSKCNCPSCQHAEQVDQYNTFNLKAHSAYMSGLPEQAAYYYHQAFEISAELLALSTVSKDSVKRCTDACINCLEYCHHSNEFTDNDYLEITSELLSKITQGQHTKDIQSAALEAYADIARLAQWRFRRNHCRKSAEIVSDFTKLWNSHAPSLIGIH